MVYTERAPRWQQSPVAPVMRQASSAVRTALRWTFKTPCKATVIHLESRASRAQSVCSEAENSAILKRYQSISQSINQSVNQSINPSIDRSINQSINQSINRQIDRSINQSIDRSINQSINQSSVSRAVLCLDSGKGAVPCLHLAE